MHYNEYLNISHKALISKGVYNGYLNKDSMLHIDPLLLKECSIPEFKNAYKDFLSYFKSFIVLVKHVKKPCDLDYFFKEIIKRFTFKEIPNTGLGYSKKRSGGNGISGNLSLQLALTAYEIIKAGMEDPEIFCLMQLFEDNIGPDRISDMTIAIIQTHFLRYTHRVSGELNIATKKFHFQGADYYVPFYKGKPILFIPMCLLADLPIAHNYEDIENVCQYNQELKRRVAQIIGLTWNDYHKFKKSDWRNLIISNVACYKSAISFYKGLKGISYDFQNDEKEQYQDILIEDYFKKYPIEFTTHDGDSIEKKIDAFTQLICIQFKHLVEDNRLSELFFRKNRNPDEKDWQLLFYTVADTYRKAAKVDIAITREDNPGVGQIDFHISKGTRVNTIIEIKRSGNKDLYHGYRTQLAAYVRAERATSAVFMVIIEDDSYEQINQRLIEIQEDMKANGEYVPKIVYINGKRQCSASHPKYENPRV